MSALKFYKESSKYKKSDDGITNFVIYTIVTLHNYTASQCRNCQ